MYKLIALLALTMSSYASTDFTLKLENYESFGGEVPVKVIDARAQVVSESYSQGSRKCYRRTGLWSSESKPYTAKQNLRVKLSGNKITLKDATVSMGTAANYVRSEVPSYCEIRTKVTLLVKTKALEDQREYLLHGEILINQRTDDYYLQSGADYYFQENPNVSMVKMPRIPNHIMQEIWSDLDARSSSRMNTNF
ncbi:hypothetical protein BIY24_08420 [Halobacteriovorax marinus]|uniref:hypothetical protein n=1 Tax=Halobacteriovorax marinus TaxID=97084 RepID=UPI000BC2F815|nr:hypothetical protein [Halobacteriovorax marinus]ATH07974.1 hypothetical protein BIY24_08420 [Halobacteriovorax marinus]